MDSYTLIKAPNYCLEVIAHHNELVAENLTLSVCVTNCIRFVQT